MHVVLRRYQIRSGNTRAVEERAREHLVPALHEVPGFQSYYLVSEGSGSITSIALFRTKTGAIAGDRLCADWFRADWPTFRAVSPESTVGETLVQSEVPAAAPPPESERRRESDRRQRGDRRHIRDRRAPPELRLSAGT